MSKADELFKSLGYEIVTKNGNYIKYLKDDDNVYYFLKDVKEFYKSGEYDGMCGNITMQELKAINEKVKELRLEIETSLKSDKKERENKMDKKYPPIVGKCKERLDSGICLGCNRLELYEFTGDDDCPEFRDEKGLKNEDRIYRNNNLYNT